jgi:hypothetical protein
MIISKKNSKIRQKQKKRKRKTRTKCRLNFGDGASHDVCIREDIFLATLPSCSNEPPKIVKLDRNHAR